MTPEPDELQQQKTNKIISSPYIPVSVLGMTLNCICSEAPAME